MELYLKNRSSNIYRALIKYGYSKFNLEIIEYCEPDKAIEREQFYLDTLKPTYNILTIAGSRLGVKHSEETKKLMSILSSGKNNPLFGKTHSEKTILLMSIAQKNRPKEQFVKSEETKSKISKTLGHKIEVMDINFNSVVIFDTIGEAARYLNIGATTVSRYVQSNKLYKDRYLLKKIDKI